MKIPCYRICFSQASCVWMWIGGSYESWQRSGRFFTDRRTASGRRSRCWTIPVHIMTCCHGETASLWNRKATQPLFHCSDVSDMTFGLRKRFIEHPGLTISLPVLYNQIFSMNSFFPIKERLNVHFSAIVYVYIYVVINSCPNFTFRKRFISKTTFII